MKHPIIIHFNYALEIHFDRTVVLKDKKTIKNNVVYHYGSSKTKKNKSQNHNKKSIICKMLKTVHCIK